MVITIPELLGGGLALLLLNIIVWAFAWGRTVGKVLETVENQGKRLDDHERKHKSHVVLNDCQHTFSEIMSRLSGLEAKMEILIGRD